MTTRRSVIANAARVVVAATLILGFAAVTPAHADPTGQDFVSVYLKYGVQPCYFNFAQSDGRGSDHQAELAIGSVFNFLGLFTFIDVRPLSQMQHQGISMCQITDQDII